MNSSEAVARLEAGVNQVVEAKPSHSDPFGLVAAGWFALGRACTVGPDQLVAGN